MSGTVSRRLAIALAATLLLSLLLRVVPLTLSHAWDETVFLQHARVMLDGRSNYDEFIHRPPLLSALYAVGFAFWDDPFAAHFVQGLATTLGVLFGFLYARRAFGPGPAFACALLLGFTPYLVFASHQLLTDMPALTLILAAMWLYDRPGARWAFAAGVAAGLAILTRYTSGFVMLYFLLLALALPGRWRCLGALLLGAALALAPYLAWNKAAFGGYFFPFEQAQKIVRLWTAPVPARMYWEGLLEVFPPAVWLLFTVGLARAGRSLGAALREGGSVRARLGRVDPESRRQAVLLAWGAAYLAYMLSIPHKEVRYLAPLAIPVCVVAALGLDALLAWSSRRGTGVQAAAAGVLALAVALDIAPGFRKLADPWVDSSEWPTVQVAGWLARNSAPDDVIYAVHDFPVLAYYTGCKTVSLLPIQDDFAGQWRTHMDRPGYFVHFRPEGISETHSTHKLLMPDGGFLETTPGFRRVAVFPTIVVYRYRPAG